MSFIAQLHESIDRRLQELRTEITKIEQARTALSNGSGKPVKTQANGTEVKPHGRRRKTKVLAADQLEAILGESVDGLSTAVIAEHAGADPSQVLALLRELEKGGRVRRSGARRGTRWHLVTDEDRVAQRAADLASRSNTNR